MLYYSSSAFPHIILLSKPELLLLWETNFLRVYKTDYSYLVRLRKKQQT